MRKSIAAIAALCLHLSCLHGTELAAQASNLATAPALEATTPELDAPDSGAVHFARFRHYGWNGVNVWAGNAYETRSASHNEHIAGSLRILGLQVSRDVWRGKRGRVAYLGEVLPVMLVRSGPPANRAPDTLHASAGFFSQDELKRFSYRNAYGFGIAPFGIETTYQLSKRASALFNMTAGGLIFTKIVPYGKGTQPNFTVSPGVALQWDMTTQTRVAFGYTFHHLSNASFGQSNPGMNSQMLLVRVSRLRKS